jgi:hypothetical protein
MDAIPPALINDLKYQFDRRLEQAKFREVQYVSDDPIDSLDLTDYQRGIIRGRAQTWEFVNEMFHELVNKHVLKVESQ